MTDNWGKLAVGVRLRAPDPYFVNSWIQVVANGLRKGDILLIPSMELPHASALNFLVEQFMKSDAETLLLLDDDMVFDQQAVESLRLAGEGFDILSGLTVARCGGGPVALNFDGSTGRHEPMTEALKAGGIVPVDITGMFFTLIRRVVVEALYTKADTFRYINGLGEDGDFCRRAKSLDFKIGVATFVNIGHRVTSTWTWDREKNTTNIMASDNIPR